MKLLHQAAVKRYILEVAKLQGRPFTRVSKDFLQSLETSLRTQIHLRLHAARGMKTLKP